MSTAATYSMKGFNQRTRASGHRPIGAASFRQQSTDPPSPPPPHAYASGSSWNTKKTSQKRLCPLKAALPPESGFAP